MRLTPKQEKFCLEYLRVENATEAYRIVYNSKAKPETCARNGFKLLENNKIVARIDDLRAESAKIAVITQAGILDKLMKVSDASMSLNEDGAMVAPNSAVRALELLGRHVGLWPKESADVQVNIGAQGSFESALSKIEFIRCEGGIVRTEGQLDALRDRCIGVIFSLWQSGQKLPEGCTYGGMADSQSPITFFNGTMSLMEPYREHHEIEE
jgi:hypothetical protein